MTAALELSESLARAVAQAGRGVVRVEAREAPATGAVWSPDGIVVTASHVVEREEALEVALPDGTTLPAALVGRDPDVDVAVLRVAAQGLVPAPWDAGDALAVGHLVLALARPGRTVRATAGIVSALGSEPWRTPTGGRIDRYVETDVALRPGFSGGPLVDAGGRAVGLDTAGILRGHALAVPTATVRRVVEAVLAHGGVRRGYLGIATLPVRLGRTSGLDQDRALLVTAVEEASPAAAAGLLLGDAIVAFDGRPTGSAADLLALLEEERIGRACVARVVRAGAVVDKTVTVGARAPREGCS